MRVVVGTLVNVQDQGRRLLQVDEDDTRSCCSSDRSNVTVDHCQRMHENEKSSFAAVRFVEGKIQLFVIGI